MAEDDIASANLFYERGNSHYEKGDFKSAIWYYDKAIGLDPQDHRFYYNRGLAKACLEDYDNAIPDIQKVLELRENFADAYYILGLAYEYKKMFDEAIKQYRNALDLNPEFKEAQRRLDGCEVEKKRKLDSPLISKASSSKQDSSEHSALLEQVRKLVREGEIFEALSLLEETLRRDPDDFHLLLSRRIVMSRIEKHAKHEAVCGLEDVKDAFDQILTALKNSKHPLYQATIARSSKSMILHGPPGCGKTLVTVAQARESGIELIEIVLSEILNMWAGESEKRLAQVFEKAKEMAQSGRPTILFIDELDALGLARGVVAESGESSWSRDLRNTFRRLFNEVQDIPNLIIIGATNYLWAVDDALKRPGRIGSWIIYVPPPDERTRSKLFGVFSAETPGHESVDFKKLASITSGFSGDEIRNVCRGVHLEIAREIVKKNRHRTVARTEDYIGFIERRTPASLGWIRKVSKAWIEGKIEDYEIDERLQVDIDLLYPSAKCEREMVKRLRDRRRSEDPNYIG